MDSAALFLTLFLFGMLGERYLFPLLDTIVSCAISGISVIIVKFQKKIGDVDLGGMSNTEAIGFICDEDMD